MKWIEKFPKETKPDFIEFSKYIDNNIWDSLCKHIEGNYKISPLIEYSCCSCAPGWNAKYKKGGRSLCTLYPNEGFFTGLVSIGSKEAMETELLLATFTDYVREQYWNVKPFNGSRWMMIDVKEEAVLGDFKNLVDLRFKYRNAKKAQVK